MIFRHFVAAIVALTILPPSEPNVAQAFSLNETYGRKFDKSKVERDRLQSIRNEYVKKLSKGIYKTSGTNKSSTGKASKVVAPPAAAPTVVTACPLAP